MDNVFWAEGLSELRIWNIGSPLAVLIKEVPRKLELIELADVLCLTSEVFIQDLIPRLCNGRLSSFRLIRSGLDLQSPEIMEALRKMLLFNKASLKELDFSCNCIGKTVVDMLCSLNLELNSLVLKSLVSPEKFDYLKSLPRLASSLCSKAKPAEPLKITISHYQIDTEKIGE